MPIVTMSLPVNVFLSALVVFAFPLSKTAIGVLSALPFAGNFLQIFITSFLTRWHPPKTVTVIAASLHLVAWLALGLALPWLPREEPEVAGAFLLGWFLVSSVLSAIAGVTWNAWIQDWVPARLRGKYFGRRNGILQLSTLTFLLVAGWSLARWEYAIGVFQLIIAGAAAIRVLSLRWQWMSPTPSPKAAVRAELPLREQLRVVLAARSLLLFIAFGAVWSFAANAFGPFYTVFMLEQLRFSAWDVSVVNALALLGGAVALPVWGYLLDRYGNKSVMAASLLLWQTSTFAWCFLTPENRAILYALWLWAGITGAGFLLGQFTLLLRLAPASARSLAIGANLAVTSCVAAAAPIIGGATLTWALRQWAPLTVYHACFVVQPVLALIGCTLLRRIHEPNASSVSMVFGAMRNVRMISSVLGLDFFVNYVFYRPPKPDAR